MKDRVTKKHNGEAYAKDALPEKDALMELEDERESGLGLRGMLNNPAWIVAGIIVVLAIFFIIWVTN